MTRFGNRWIGATLATVALALAGCAATPGDDEGPGDDGPATYVEAVPMINHVQFGVFEQDVYIQRVPGADVVFRPTPANATDALLRDAPLYATADEVEHDPTFSNDGPFDKGDALGVTLSQWLAGNGGAAYLCEEDRATLDATYSALVPNGLYTMWYFTLEMTDGAITGGQDLPAGPADGSANTFRAGADGSARFSVSWDGCLAPATAGPGIAPTGTARGFAIALHSDGMAHGEHPGPFGQKTHVQLFGLMRAGA